MKKFKAEHNAGESTVQLFKKKYLEELKDQKEGEVTAVGTNKRARKVLLVEELDNCRNSTYELL